ncbi:hypothetical protein L596_025072 [Steinernema carpocapsae]|uniref:ISXO2-like transposase domain-containing protein n=1 Tax=Steinernema carpocapsae TaxID=34508 RepID=A0A4U5M6W1_STECR|nr:hypothetical protein L596_025072 [Steinernema carpocapsae]
MKTEDDFFEGRNSRKRSAEDGSWEKLQGSKRAVPRTGSEDARFLADMKNEDDVFKIGNSQKRPADDGSEEKDQLRTRSIPKTNLDEARFQGADSDVLEAMNSRKRSAKDAPKEKQPRKKRAAPRAGVITTLVPLVHQPNSILELSKEGFTPDDLFAFLGYDESPESKRKTIDFLALHGLLKNRHFCPNEQHSPSVLQKDCKSCDMYMWRCLDCRATGKSGRCSLREGSIFEQSHLSLRTILLLLHNWAYLPTTRLDDVQMGLGLARRTITDFYNLFREICRSWNSLQTWQSKLGGPESVVEIEESQYIVDKDHRRRKQEGESGWIFAFTELGTNRVRLFETADKSEEALVTLIEAHLAPGTKIIVDHGLVYKDYKQLEEIFTFVDPYHVMNISRGAVDESLWRELKAELRDIWGTTPKTFQCYMYEYAFRRFHDGKKIFEHILMVIRELYTCHVPSVRGGQ